MEISKQIGDQIKRIRKQQGLTQEDIANKLGTSKQYIWNIENGRATVSFDRLNEICKALGKRLDVRIK